MVGKKRATADQLPGMFKDFVLATVQVISDHGARVANASKEVLADQGNKLAAVSKIQAEKVLAAAITSSENALRAGLKQVRAMKKRMETGNK